uniref:BREX-1 system adenine-specific DNA-methyltransferase PglX n=1 Tax=Roseimaritima sediminicola TaxID=2662066 RepID=UPI0012982756
METSKLRKFASQARKSLLELVGTRMKSVLADGSLARRESPKAVAELEAKIKELGREQTIEMVAYTWFNRFCALRYMDVNRYTKIGVVSPPEGQFQPEILAEAKMGHVDEELVPAATREKVMRLLDETDPSDDPQGEAYRLLLVAVCNYYHGLMPFMFEKIADFTELLLPDDLLSGNSILAYTREALLPINCSPEHTEESVEVLGWLYQFYIADKKDDVFAALKKGKKITPENIPAATQLFTPHWIVRYLVENSLGRLWMLNHPDSGLIEQMDYYIRPEEPETDNPKSKIANPKSEDFLRISSPEEIKICDPACGSGHMLTYAFDLLYAIYEEQGYQPTEIPRLILKQNLYGVEIDQRAGALAAFALVMKAREKDRRFFSRKPLDEGSATAIENPKSKIQNPNVCVLENITFDQEVLSDYIEQVDPDLFTDGIRGVVNQWEEADNFGSLIRPLVTDVSEVLELLRERQMGEDLFLAGVHQKVLKALRQADYLSPKYHVVVANPPYLGNRGMNPSMTAWVKKNFPATKSDLFAMFIERNMGLANRGGLVAMVTMQSWMFLSSLEKLRARLLEENTVISLAHLGPRAFDTIGGEVVSTTAFIFESSSRPSYSGVYIGLTDGESETEKQLTLRAAVADPHSKARFTSSAVDFAKIPGSPLAYWLSEKELDLFADSPSIGDRTKPRQGMSTNDNQRFLRQWFEVPLNKLGFGFT